MKWLDIEDIAESLEEQNPDFDILSVRFTVLKKMVMELEDFDDSTEKCNEKILEAIQGAWIEIREE